MRVQIRSARSAAIALLTAVCLLGATAASSAPSPVTPKRIVDNETVYAVMDATGALRTTIVVDWLQVEGTGTMTLADPAAAADSIETLTDGFAPALAGGLVTADVTVEGNGDYFYRAETTAELPLDVRVTYFLDGAETPPAELAGKSGRLRIDIALHNRLDRTETITYAGADGAEQSTEVTYTVPLLCIPQLKIDGTRMTNIVPPDGAQLAITGNTLTYAIPMLPSPDETASIEMDARDIELASMIISVFPKLPASADFSVADDLIDLRDGLSRLGQLSVGHLQVVDGIVGGMGAYDLTGATQAAEGIAALRTSLGTMARGAGDLAKLSAGQRAYLDGVINGIDAGQFDSLGQLQAAIGQMRQGAAELEAGVNGLSTLLDGQIALTAQLQASNSALAGAAAGLAAADTTNTALAGVASGLAQQDALLSALLDGGNLGAGFMPGLRYTREQLAGIATGLAGLKGGLEQLEAQSAGLFAIPGAFAQLKNALIVLRDGGAAGPQQLPGLATTSSGLDGLASGLGQAEAGLAGSAGQLSQLSGISALMKDLRSALEALGRGGTVQGRTLPGITTTIDALGTTADGLGSGVDDIREGEALMEAMKASAEAYTTFLGLPEGAEGHLSFLFKLDGVAKE